MFKLNQIQAQLQQIDQAKFQDLCDLYLRSLDQYKNVRSIGTVPGEDKVAKGTPDSIFTLADGTLAFANYTTQKTKLLNKLKRDFEKCFQEQRTHIPASEISEIIFCHNRMLSLQDERELLEMGRARGVRVTVVGQDKLSYECFEDHLAGPSAAASAPRVVPLPAWNIRRPAGDLFRAAKGSSRGAKGYRRAARKARRPAETLQLPAGEVM